jgi:hypothetical protein
MQDPMFQGYVWVHNGGTDEERLYAHFREALPPHRECIVGIGNAGADITKYEIGWTMPTPSADGPMSSPVLKLRSDAVGLPGDKLFVLYRMAHQRTDQTATATSGRVPA